MKKTYILVTILLFCAFRDQIRSQDVFSIDRELSLLRGPWEFHTYYDKWELVFQSDIKLIVDREQVTYQLSPGRIHINDTELETPYLYTLKNDKLTLTSPDGKQITYHRDDPGENEQRFDGQYTFSDSTVQYTIWFSEGREFSDLSGRHEDVANNTQRLISAHGLYRVEGDVLILTFDDGTTHEAKIGERDQDGMVLNLIYHEKLFQKESPSPLVEQDNNRHLYTSQSTTLLELHLFSSSTSALP
ncbi:MAG: hypothetical protein HY707_01920 [Ignavibacteriae bacterium]|nr:hypothetical protein [Ignavibacteriota bacterium]